MTGWVDIGAGALLDVPELERSSRAQQVLAEVVAVCRRLLGA